MDRSLLSWVSRTCGCRFSTRFRIRIGGQGRFRGSISHARHGSISRRPTPTFFPCLRLAYRALEAARSLPVVLNAANEIAVALFLDGKLGFTGIAAVIEQTMTAHRPAEVRTLAEVRAVDQLAREHAREIARGLELKV